jgi:hypothetical protein
MDADDLDLADPRERIRYRSDDATLWVWIFYGLAQATITMLMAFDVIDTLTATEVCTAVMLIVYVAVNELYVRPRRSGKRQPVTPRPEPAVEEPPEPAGPMTAGAVE